MVADFRDSALSFGGADLELFQPTGLFLHLLLSALRVATEIERRDRQPDRGREGASVSVV
jgi:hypothetical protein